MNYYNENDPKAAAWLRELIRAGLIPDGDVDTRSITDISPHDLTGYTQHHFFAGIGGWSLALRLAGWPTTRPVWTGSCPCQPFSDAGKGKGTKDERHLWPVFFALIRACAPSVVFGEQVASALVVGKVGRKAKADNGPVWLDGISEDLEQAGYTVGACVLGAHSVGAPHIRQRLYWVANAAGTPRAQQLDEPGRGTRRGPSAADTTEHPGLGGRLGNTHGAGPQPGHDASEADRHRRAALADGGAGWLRVSFAGECLGGEDGELGDECAICGLDYSNECQCPGPTQDDEFEYDERNGILYARRLVFPVCTRLEGLAGDGHDRHEPGRLDTDAARPTAAPSGLLPAHTMQFPAHTMEPHGDTSGAWSRFDLIPCADGKTRRIEPGLAPLAHGIPARVVRLRGYGNAIVPQVAAEFIGAFLDVTTP
jgi:DNA (cytosine-5)-methyltransferase 1